MKCKHKHECEACIRIEIKQLEEKISALKAKLPPSQTNIYYPSQPIPQYVPWNGITYYNSQTALQTQASVALAQ